MPEWHGIGHMSGLWWWILGLLVIVLAIWAGSRTRLRQGGAGGESAEERLKRRFRAAFVQAALLDPVRHGWFSGQDR